MSLQVTIHSTFSADNMGSHVGGGHSRPNKATPQRPNKATPSRHGAGASPRAQGDKEYANVTVNPGQDSKIWAELARKLPTKRSDADKAVPFSASACAVLLFCPASLLCLLPQARVKLFNQFDPNGNGYLSLAEVDKGVRDVLQCHQVLL